MCGVCCVCGRRILRAGHPVPFSLLAPLFSHCLTGCMLHCCALWFLCTLTVGAPFYPPNVVSVVYTLSCPLQRCSPLLHPPFIVSHHLKLGSVRGEEDPHRRLFPGN